ncbi:uncharacterized protein PV07_08085 [Cladophialophora immunda]|uniref:Uncharacterized protein n=1 Tax=Cladophialophora immunda TaxID=569365 RepID=A0A0D2CBI3_9EURO|nr:uncharacterized protein PV07_08085 [Cladophialophora immunda]KIW28418.1 hypothetical protein PV07_08085 [Cladophialophora immunda]
MCRIKLHICPYPDHDPVSSLIFNPKNGPLWELCNNPRPWGRLSCGKLEVEHPKQLTRSGAPLSSPNPTTTDSCNSEQCEKHKQEFPEGHGPVLVNPIAPMAAGEARPLGKPCKWCTAVLRLAATKSKEMQKLAQTEIAEVERKMSEDSELRKMHKEIADREQELNRMRHSAWRKATAMMDDLVDKNAKNETQG